MFVGRYLQREQLYFPDEDQNIREYVFCIRQMITSILRIRSIDTRKTNTGNSISSISACMHYPEHAKLWD